MINCANRVVESERKHRDDSELPSLLAIFTLDGRAT